MTKPAVREKVKSMLDDKIMGVLEAIYWSDKRLASGELNALAAGDLKKALAVTPTSAPASTGFFSSSSRALRPSDVSFGVPDEISFSK